MSSDLEILGAAYGKADVTAKVREYQKGPALSVIAKNSVFGDTWRGHDKSLVVVYKYGDKAAEVKVVKEGKTLEINGPQVNSRTTTESSQLNILGAVYGLCDVTVNARGLISNNVLDQPVSNDLWGQGWRRRKKTLVVVYEYRSNVMVEIAVQGERINIIASPPLTILGAAYGVKNVTDKAQELVKNCSLNVQADDSTFGDGWRKNRKSLVVVYQYGGETPSVAVVQEGKKMVIRYSRKGDYHGPRDPGELAILGAVYGLGDVTTEVRRKIKDKSTLDINANNDTFRDRWRGKKKSFVVVYQYGGNAPKISIVKEDANIHIAIASSSQTSSL